MPSDDDVIGAQRRRGTWNNGDDPFCEFWVFFEKKERERVPGEDRRGDCLVVSAM